MNIWMKLVVWYVFSTLLFILNDVDNDKGLVGVFALVQFAVTVILIEIDRAVIALKEHNNVRED